MSLVISAFAFCTASSLAPDDPLENTQFRLLNCTGSPAQSVNPVSAELTRTARALDKNHTEMARQPVHDEETKSLSAQDLKHKKKKRKMGALKIHTFFVKTSKLKSHK